MGYENLTRVIDVISALRDPKTGCPWDLEQDHQSLLKYLVEESYEYIEAVDNQDVRAMEEELGDVFLQVLLHSQIASESGKFDIDSVSKVLADKMIHRHPHVFKKESSNLSSQEVVDAWQELKGKKKQAHHITSSDVYAPSLSAASTIGAKSQAVNFDWDNVNDVVKKVDEELLEVKEEMSKDLNSKELYEEMGDLLFSVAQLARHLKIDPEQALRDANLKFVKRINLVEDKVHSDNKEMSKLPTSELEIYWSKVKKELKDPSQA